MGWNPRFHAQPPRVLLAELILFAASVYIYWTQVAVKGMCIAPLLLIFTVYLEWPPPGLGIGQPAGPLPNLKFLKLRCHEKLADAPPPLGPGGEVLPGHAYVFVFWSYTKSCLKTVPRIQHLSARTRKVPKVHLTFICRDDPDQLDAWVARSKGLNTPVAHDAEAEAFKNYVRASTRARARAARTVARRAVASPAPRPLPRR